MTHWTERHKVLLAVYVLLRKGDEVLLLRRANTGYMDGKFSLPAGHADGNESALTAAVRETKEEAGVAVKPADMRLVHTGHRMAEEGGFEYVDLFFETTTWQGKPTIMEPEKCSELRWADSGHLPADMVPYVRGIFAHLAAHEPYSDFNFVK